MGGGGDAGGRWEVEGWYNLRGGWVRGWRATGCQAGGCEVVGTQASHRAGRKVESSRHGGRAMGGLGRGLMSHVGSDRSIRTVWGACG